MASKNWQAGGAGLIGAQVLSGLIAAVAPCGPAWAMMDDSAPAGHFGAVAPDLAWEIAIAAIVLSAFLGAVAIWVHAALQRVKGAQLRRTAYLSSALNSLSHGVVMTDPKGRILYLNDRYLDIYG